MYLHFSILDEALGKRSAMQGMPCRQSLAELAEPPWIPYITYDASRLAAKGFILVKDIGYAHDRSYIISLWLCAGRKIDIFVTQAYNYLFSVLKSVRVRYVGQTPMLFLCTLLCSGLWLGHVPPSLHNCSWSTPACHS